MATSQEHRNGRLHTGDLQLDLDQRRTLREGDDLKLSRLTFKLMHALASAAPALVTKDELADRVWDGRIVSPETVAQRIKLLRQALRDDANCPRYVEVVRGQGYRWIPDVLPEANPTGNGSFFSGNRDAASGVALVRPDRPSVVVLPFDTLGDRKLDHRIFADGLSHDLITCLGRSRWLFVVARGSAFMFRGSGHPASDVAAKLGVRYVVQGSVIFSGSRIRVNAALADADSGKEIWSEILQGDAGDIFSIQEEISTAIVAAVEVAWAAYHRGWWHLNCFAADSCDQGEHFFRRSLQMDPEFARAHAGLSCVYWLRAFLEVSADRNGDIERSLEYAQTSVSLDRRDPLTHWALGRALHLCKKFEQSVQAFELSNELNPNFAFGQFAQAFAMMHLGKNELSNQIIAKARRLSPYDPMCYAMLGVQAINHALLGDYDRAADISVRGASLQAWRCQMFPVIAAVCNVLADRKNTANDHYQQLLQERPGYRADDYFRAFPHQRESDIETINTAFDSLRRFH
jgi:TolB-like protein